MPPICVCLFSLDFHTGVAFTVITNIQINSYLTAQSIYDQVCKAMLEA